METTQEQALSARELLENLYQYIYEHYGLEKLEFPEPAYTIIAIDQDYHRTRRGNMVFEDAIIFEVDGRRWILTLGNKGGSYPGDQYAIDLELFELPEDLYSASSEDLINWIMRNIDKHCDWFRHSLLISLVDGSIGAKMVTPGRELFGKIENTFSLFIAEKATINKNLLMASTLRPLVSRATSYKPEFAGYLANSLIHILKS